MDLIEASTMNVKQLFEYTKPKLNSSGGKNIGIINKNSKKGLYLQTPLMLTWGVNTYEDEKTGRKTFDMALQFPKEEYNSENIEKFLNNMKELEKKILDDALINSKEWLNKGKASMEVLKALWTPILKYPKDEDGEPDYSRPPTLKLKIPFWEENFNIELYDMNNNQIFPNESELTPSDLIAKATNVATIIQCGGIWVASGKFGVTWKLIQAVVKPKESLKGKCHIALSTKEKEILNATQTEDKNDEDDDDSDNDKEINRVQVVDSDSDNESDNDNDKNTKKEIEKEVAELLDEKVEDKPPPTPQKKKVIRKKKAAE